MTSSEKLKSFRQEHNLTQQQLADLLGVKQQTITYIETGARKPSNGFKLAFLKYYNVDFDKLGLEQEKAWNKTSDEISKVNSEYTLKLKQALAEIKEIITTALEQNTLINLDKILQKISEVIDDRN